MQDHSSILFHTKEELRDWLVKNCATKESIWVVYYKKAANKGTLTINEIADTAICYGWIDSQVKTVDADRARIRISPRNPKSNWSRVNKERVKRLIATKQMTAKGMALIEEAKKNGSWDALNDVENLVLPPDMNALLEKELLLADWEALSRSVKRAFLEQLQNTKRAETRQRKLQGLVVKLKADFAVLCNYRIARKQHLRK